MSWDVLLTLLNLVGRKHRTGRVTPEGHPGYRGHWPEYRPLKETDSRCSCPALNTLANHGIISRSGRGISFVELDHHVRGTYSISTTISSYVPHYAARMLKRSYGKDTFDLEELDLHNWLLLCLGLDSAFESNQSIKQEGLLVAATGNDKDGNDGITTKELSKILGKRRAVARAVNKEFSLKLFHKICGSAKYFIASSVSKHNPDRSESSVRQPHGLTLTNFNKTALSIEFGVRENDWEEAAREAAENGTTPT
ncbi:heme-thiolate peroxidase aromatic peroxygenase [Suillus lakei]|nr:heme-thiolate peroxidase aromatic peroxygenase [Suillus lakei]